MAALFGLIGHPVSHSLSPPVMKAALADLSIEGDYRLFDLEPGKVDSGLDELLARGVCGFNVTVPHKITLFERCDETTPEARKVKAVNAVKVDAGSGLKGHNTDVGGFMRALSDIMPPNLQRNYACVIGAGGAARAAVWSLVYLGWWKIYVMARNPDKARYLIEEVAEQIEAEADGLSPRHFFPVSTDLTELRHIPDVIVNATTVGLEEGDAPDWAYDLLKLMNPNGVFFDMVYTQTGQPTTLAGIARKLRLSNCDGAEMLIHQAWLTLEFWTGKRPNIDCMRQALLQARKDRQETAGSSFTVTRHAF